MHDLAQSRQESAENQRQVQVERQRLLHLRQRLERRFHRHWSSERNATRLREVELDTQRRALEKEREQIQQEKTALMQARMQLNGEMELGRRQLQADWESLHQAQAEVRERTSAVDLREKDLVAGQHRLIEEKQRWEADRSGLQQEVEGLESRIANSRRILLDEQQKLDRLRQDSKQLPPSSSPALPPIELEQTSKTLPIALPVHIGTEERQGPFHRLGAEWRDRVARLQWVAESLADERLHLAELYEGITQTQHQWEQDRSLIATELEGLAQRLCQREEAIQLREDAVTTGEHRLEQRAAEIARQWGHLEGRSAKLAARAAIWEGEKEFLLSSLRAREELVGQQLTALGNLRQCWGKRRLHQVGRLRAERVAYGELRREGEALRLDYVRRSTLLGKEQRALLERALALEQYRQRCIARAANPKAAEKRLERLRRRWAALAASAERTLARERKALEIQAAQLQERSGQFQQDAGELAAREAELTAREATWEQKQLQEQREQEKVQQELNSLRRQRQTQEQQLATLREEMERLARVLLEDNDPKPLPAARAA